MDSWKACNKILCIRADNMGDVLMSAPAIRMLRNFSESKISLLTSSKGALAAELVAEIDEVIVADLAFVKLEKQAPPNAVLDLIATIREKKFDACVVFTVYSQNPMPSIMIAYLAGIPLRLAHCRENPYALLTQWVPDPEPYTMIRHQVERDMALISSLGIPEDKKDMFVDLSYDDYESAFLKVESLIASNGGQPYLVLHPGVSDAKRRYPFQKWVACGKQLADKIQLPMLVTGSVSEREECEALAKSIGNTARSVAGMMNTKEFAAVIDMAAVIITVNTVAVHIASACKTPVVVLYAQTNPQHTPWMTASQVLEYSVIDNTKSKNEVIRHVDKMLYGTFCPPPEPEEVVRATVRLLGRKPHSAVAVKLDSEI